MIYTVNLWDTYLDKWAPLWNSLQDVGICVCVYVCVVCLYCPFLESEDPHTWVFGIRGTFPCGALKCKTAKTKLNKINY